MLKYEPPFYILYMRIPPCQDDLQYELANVTSEHALLSRLHREKKRIKAVNWSTDVLEAEGETGRTLAYFFIVTSEKLSDWVRKVNKKK